MNETRSDGTWFIDSRAGLAALAERVNGASFLGIDTEFERRRTYFAELCLIQLAVDERMVCVDALAVGTIAPLIEALGRNPAPKILHAARQDLEVLSQAGGALFEPVLDTQIAAGLAGYPEQIGYADLAADLLGHEIDKSQTRTDWRTRPLSTAQLEYAINDVRYLRPIMERLSSRLVDLGRRSWLDEDCATLTRPELYTFPVEDAWRRVKGMGNLPDGAFGFGTLLAAWREQTARERNLPRNWVIKDSELLCVAAVRPASVRELEEECELSPAAVRRHGSTLVALASQRNAGDSIERPRPRQLPDSGKETARLLSARVREIGETLGIAPALILTRREIEMIVGGGTPDRLADGWRRRIAGDAIAAIRRPQPGVSHG